MEHPNFPIGSLIRHQTSGNIGVVVTDDTFLLHRGGEDAAGVGGLRNQIPFRRLDGEGIITAGAFDRVKRISTIRHWEIWSCDETGQYVKYREGSVD